MTYSPGPPGGSGYPSGSYGAPSPSYASASDAGAGRLPAYLNIAVVLLGVVAYVAAFGPVYASSTNFGPFTVEATSTGGIMLTLAAVLAALLAAIGLLPKTKAYPTVVAVFAVVGVLSVLEQVVNKPQVMSPSGPVPATVGWALWLVLAFTLLQAIAAVLVLLFDTGVLTPPAPKPRYEAHYGQYGQYGAPAGYYPQQGGQPRPQYPSQYGGGYPQSPSTGGFGAPGSQGGADQGPPTPPTGYPTFGSPPAVGKGQHHATNPNLGPLSSPASSNPASSNPPSSPSVTPPSDPGSTGSAGSPGSTA